MSNFLSINADHVCKSWSITKRDWNIKRLLQTKYFVPFKQFNGVKVYVLFAFKKIDISCRKVLNKTHFAFLIGVKQSIGDSLRARCHHEAAR